MVTCNSASPVVLMILTGVVLAASGNTPVTDAIAVGAKIACVALPMKLSAIVGEPPLVTVVSTSTKPLWMITPDGSSSSMRLLPIAPPYWAKSYTILAIPPQVSSCILDGMGWVIYFLFLGHLGWLTGQKIDPSILVRIFSPQDRHLPLLSKPAWGRAFGLVSFSAIMGLTAIASSVGSVVIKLRWLCF